MQPARPKSHKKKIIRRIKVKKRVSYHAQDRALGWDERFHVADSKNNNTSHQFYREYFDKKPKENATHFRIKYAGSINELPGIANVNSKLNTKTKDFKGAVVSDKPHQNKWKMLQETRMPLKKGQTNAFPSTKEHV